MGEMGQHALHGGEEGAMPATNPRARANPGAPANPGHQGHRKPPGHGKLHPLQQYFLVGRC